MLVGQEEDVAERVIYRWDDIYILTELSAHTCWKLIGDL